MNRRYKLPTIFQYVYDLFEQTEPINKLVVIYPGRFQPFHRGHASVYQMLQKRYPTADVRIATSGVTDPQKSPFTFEQKRQLMLFSGMDPQSIKQVKSPYAAVEILAEYELATTGVLFAISEKDMLETPRFSFKTKKDGSPSFFQPYPADGKIAPATKHGYIVTIPTLKFQVNGEMVNSASQIRDAYRVGSAEDRKRIVFDLYGKVNNSIYQIFNTALVDSESPPI